MADLINIHDIHKHNLLHSIAIYNNNFEINFSKKYWPLPIIKLLTANILDVTHFTRDSRLRC